MEVPMIRIHDSSLAGLARRIAACLALAALAGGCHSFEPPVETAQTNNPNISVALLFSKDGCDVYRFRDASTHYFVRCKEGAIASTITPVRCGKGCVRDEEVQTVAEDVSRRAR
jgi:hypothetical protein